MANCGECLMSDVEVVALDANGTCPRCKTHYGAPYGVPLAQAPEDEDDGDDDDEDDDDEDDDLDVDVDEDEGF